MQRLEQQGGFPNAGVTAHQDDGAGDDSPAQDPIKLVQARGPSNFVGHGNVTDGSRRFLLSDLPLLMGIGAGPYFFLESIPLSAIRTSPPPSRGLEPTGLTDEDRTGFGDFHANGVQPVNVPGLQLLPDFLPRLHDLRTSWIFSFFVRFGKNDRLDSLLDQGTRKFPRPPDTGFKIIPPAFFQRFHKG